jgi:hypothetical protein
VHERRSPPRSTCPSLTEHRPSTRSRTPTPLSHRHAAPALLWRDGWWRAVHADARSRGGERAAALAAVTPALRMLLHRDCAWARAYSLARGGLAEDLAALTCARNVRRGSVRSAMDVWTATCGYPLVHQGISTGSGPQNGRFLLVPVVATSLSELRLLWRSR